MEPTRMRDGSLAPADQNEAIVQAALAADFGGPIPAAPAVVEPEPAPVAPPVTEVRILLRDRDLNGKGNGTEEHRRVALPGGAAGWAADLAGDVTGSWSRSGIRAHERRCSQTGVVPVGTVIAAFDKPLSGYRASASAEVAAGIALAEPPAEMIGRWSWKPLKGGGGILWGLSWRRVDGDVVVSLPDGTTRAV